MYDTIALETNESIVWILTDKAIIHQEFRVGFLYGALFSIKTMANGAYLTVYDHRDKDSTVVRYHTLYDIANDNLHMFDCLLVPLQDLSIPTAQAIEDIQIWEAAHFQHKLYIFWLRDAFDNTKANLITCEFLDFFQGLFTTLNLARVPYERVLLHKPIKDGVAYNIQGLTLPKYEDLVRE